MSSEAKVSYDLKRFAGIKRDYTPEQVERLRGSIKIEYSMCKQQSKKLWELLNSEPYINTLGSLSGNHAVQHAKAGLKAIYLSGWQVAADANSAGEMYPDQSLYPFDSAPKLVDSMNNALVRADQIQHMEIKDGDMQSKDRVDYMLPIIADGEAGFGGPLNVFELSKKFIKAGAAGVHFEDQLASEKKCGHMGGKVLVPTSTMIKNLKAARLAADIANVSLNKINLAGGDGALINYVSRKNSSEVKVIPGEFALHQNFPNPFNPSTEIRFDLPAEGKVELAIYNLMGQNIRTLYTDNMTPGYHAIIWNGTNDMGSQVATGMYFYSIQTSEFQATKKMLFLK